MSKNEACRNCKEPAVFIHESREDGRGYPRGRGVGGWYYSYVLFEPFEFRANFKLCKARTMRFNEIRGRRARSNEIAKYPSNKDDLRKISRGMQKRGMAIGQMLVSNKNLLRQLLCCTIQACSLAILAQVCL